MDLTLDGTLVSRYAEGTPLYVTLRPAGGLPPIPREQIVAFEMRYEGTELPEDARVIVHSGKLRYRTPHLTALMFNEPRLLNDLRAGDPVTVSTPLTREESRNPREEDRERADSLVRHLNGDLEFYLQAIWASLDPEFRFTLLDGMLISEAGGLSVASVVENRLIGIAGNSLIFPLAPGIRLDPRIDDESAPLEALYAANPPAALNIAIPTRGVYAEAVQGNCTACERIDDSRYWRWTTEGMLAPPPIAPVTADRPTPTDPNLTPTPLPAPLVSIQNAPELPNPTSMASILGLLAKPELFRDITGLAGTQANAAKAFNSAMTNMTAIGNDAAALAKQQLALPNTQKMLDRLQGAVASDLLTPEQAQEFAEEAIRAAIGQPKQADKLPTEDPNVAKAVKAAAESKKAEVKVTTPDETVEVKFEDKGTKIGATPIPIVLPIDEMIKQDFIVEVMRGFLTTGTRTMIAVRLKKTSEVRAVTGAAVPESGTFPLDDVPEALVKRSGEDYEIRRRLQIVYPADATDPKKVAGTGRLPLVVLVHGQHAHWTPGSTANEPNHLGYTYLQSHLAQQGIISVSVDTNAANYINSYLEMRAEMVLEAIERVAKLDQTAASPLFGRVNLSNIGLMGHSRGGDAVVVAALRDRSKGRTRIKAVCSLAPTDYTGTISVYGFNNSLKDYVETQLPEVFTENPNTLTDPGLAYLVVYGGLDGDVHGADGAKGAGGTGFRHYDRARCSKAMVYLHLCSHNRFNTSWKGDTTGRDESGISLLDLGPFAGTPGRLLLPADHRRLANEYIGGFFRWRLLGDRAQGGLFNGTVANSAAAEASLQWSFSLDATPTDLKIRDIDDMEDIAASTIGARHTNDGALGEFAAMDTSAVTPDTRTPDFRTLHQTSLYAANPNLPNASDVFRLEFLPVENWSAHKWLLLRVAADCDLTDLETIRLSKLPKFFVQLSDNKGGSARLDETNFSPTLTRPVYHDVMQQGSVVSGTVLNLDTVRVQLTAFQGVDLSAITTFQILTGGQFPKHMFFDSIQVVKEN